MTMEQPDALPDLVGRTSARLFANGVDRHDRLEALHLLAVLDASTDSAGCVRRPLDDLAAEFDLPLLGVLRSLDHLERAGAIQCNGATVALLDRQEGGVGGLQLAAFLDDVRATLGDEPQPARRRPSAWPARVGAVLVAAAALVVVTLAPSQPGVPQPVAAGSSTTIRAAAPEAEPPSIANPTTTSAAGDVPPTMATVVTPDLDIVLAARTCPVGGPVAEIAGSVLRIVNPTTADIVVQDLTIGGVSSTAPFVVAAHATVERQLPAPVIGASIDGWEWSDPGLASRCAS